MTGTLKAQLVQHNMSDKLDEVLVETAKCGENWIPWHATPFSQLVGTLAVLNVVSVSVMQLFRMK